jgi:DNA-binding transcriptional ArsR family regulator
MPKAAKPDPLRPDAERFQALGHPLRLRILRIIIQGAEAGTPAGAIQEQVGIPASTLSHHLACLSGAGLVQAVREGTFLRYRADFPGLRDLADYLWHQCRAGGTGVPSVTPRPEPITMNARKGIG